MTQQQVIIKWLQEHPEGLNSYDATYKVLYPDLYPKKIKQAPTRKKEINKMGYQTISRGNTDGSVNWILISSPVVKEVKPQVTDYSNYVFVGNRAVLREEPVQERMSL